MSGRIWVQNSRPQRVAILLVLLCVLARPARPEQLPLKLYSTADGLAQNEIHRIMRDSRGFLWFATREGLSRFDGYQFTNFTANQGLPQGVINDLLETRDGDYWVATSDGLAHFNPEGDPQRGLTIAANLNQQTSTDQGKDQPMWVTYQPPGDKASRIINVLVEERDGAIWCGTDQGVFRFEHTLGRSNFRPVEIVPGGTRDDNLIEAMIQDQQGNMWIGTGNGLYQRSPTGQVEKYTDKDGLPGTFINTLLIDSKQHLWVGTRYKGLYELTPQFVSGRSIVANLYTAGKGLGTDWIASLFESSDGVLWVGTNVGLSRLAAPSEGGDKKLVTYTTAQGLSDREVWAMAEDSSASLWLGTANGGAMKLARNGFVTYDRSDGLAQTRISSIFEDRTGAICVVTTHPNEKRIDRYDGTKFISAWPKTVPQSGWGWNQLAFQDREGDWWLDSAHGVYRIANTDRFEQLSQASVKANYTTKEGLGANEVFRLFEDSNGDVWISGIADGTDYLTKWERKTGRFTRYGPEQGILTAPTAFCEDGAGNLWIGFYGGDRIARFSHGKVVFFSESEGKPAGTVRALYLDGRHRLWIASSRGGLSRVDRPDDDHPRFVTYTMKEGLSSNDTWSITEDRWGRIYLGTGRGLDQLDPDSGDVKHYTTADGLARGKVDDAFRDRQNNLWFGTAEGLSRFVPQPEQPQTAPPVFISVVRIAGTERRISALGETAISNLVLDSQQKDLQIDFVGLDFAPGEVIRYQYKLEGAGRDWSAPTVQRSVSYANLAAGNYRFLVRAVNTAGVVSAAPAMISFTILPPVWERWWFLAIAVMFAALVIYALHRYRLAQLLALERVRTRIASDLHDDIGSGLSRLAILSEVARHEAVDGTVGDRLGDIATGARELVDSMSDIVWVINPKRDQLRDLVQRMRRFSNDLYTAAGIEFSFRAPEEQDLRVGADARRHALLIFKEAANNVARHSECTKAETRLLIEDGFLVLIIEDNGRGFDLTQAPEGNGLTNMQERAGWLKAQLQVESRRGQGTIVTLRVPLKAKVSDKNKRIGAVRG